MRNCEITRNDSNVDIKFDREVAPDLVRASGAADKAENAFQAEYGIKIKIREFQNILVKFRRKKTFFGE